MRPLHRPVHPPGRRHLILPLCAIALAGCGAHGRGKGSAEAHVTTGEPRTVTVFYLGEVRGTPEPCGCSSDPRGGMSRIVAQIKAAREGARDPSSVLFVDGGGLLYDPDRFSPDRVDEARLKADFVTAAERAADVGAVGLGYEDLLDGVDHLRLQREAVNVTAPAEVPGLGPPTVRPVVVQAGDVRVGIFGVADPDAMGHGVVATEAQAAAKGAVVMLQQQGAEVIVALLPLARADAARLVEHTPGIDFGIVAKDLGDTGLDVAQPAGAGFLLVPADRGQTLGRLDVTLRGARGAGATLVDAGGPTVAASEIARLTERRPMVAQQVADLLKEKDADPQYVKDKQAELAQIDADLAAWKQNPLRVPPSGSYFVNAVIPVKRALDCDPAVQAAKMSMDHAIGALNTKTPDPVVPAPPGDSHYIGVAECQSCHSKEVSFWKTTVHAHAYQALVEVGKQLDRDCIVCHVTGWHEPGGSAFSSYQDLENVQCEVCHGPGSLHADATNKADFLKYIEPRPTTTRCLTCHTPEQSDTFAGHEDAYLRDITGPGHGEALHAKLGPGPTAHEIRAAALARAGTAVGKNCQ